MLTKSLSMVKSDCNCFAETWQQECMDARMPLHGQLWKYNTSRFQLWLWKNNTSIFFLCIRHWYSLCPQVPGSPLGLSAAYWSSSHKPSTALQLFHFQCPVFRFPATTERRSLQLTVTYNLCDIHILRLIDVNVLLYRISRRHAERYCIKVISRE